jgi:anti-sigma regulatory factor (Ser/Thr protein kinase)
MGAAEPLLLLVVPAAAEVIPETRHRVREHLERFGVNSSAVEIAVAEAVGNAVLHAYPETDAGEVEVVVIVDDDAVEVVVRDRGIGLRSDPHVDDAGYGVILMKALADKVEFDTTPGAGTTVRMEFSRD